MLHRFAYLGAWSLLLACAENAPVQGERDATVADQGIGPGDAVAVGLDAAGVDGGADGDRDASSPADALADAGLPDLGSGLDGSADDDAASSSDAGAPADAGPPLDASAPDATSLDAGLPMDGGSVDRIYAQWPMPDSLTEYCANGTTPISCPAPGGTAFGQDGNYRAPLPSYTTTADTVTDAITGLVWQRTGLPSPRAWGDAVAFCDALILGGFADWRLPTAIELMSLADVGDQNGQLDPAVFPGFGAASYWSGTQYAYYAPNKWEVDLGAGYRDFRSISAQNNVVCVRAGNAVTGARYTIATDVATDDFTGLTWQRGVSTPTLFWTDALAYCQSLSLGGFNDWRLPSLKELNTLFDDARSTPAIDEIAFPGTPHDDTDYFWSSSPHYYYDNAAWAVKYQVGTTHAYFTDNTQAGTGRARCVR